MVPDDSVISRVAGMIASCPIGVDAVQHVHDKLASEGMSEYNIFLAFKAGEILAVTREGLPSAPKPKVKRVDDKLPCGCTTHQFGCLSRPFDPTE